MGMNLYPQGENELVARETLDDTMANYVKLAGAGAVGVGLLWSVGAFQQSPWPWLLVAGTLAVVAAMPFATRWREVRFDREARMITVVTASARGEQRRQVPFEKVVELRAAFYHNSGVGYGHHLELQLETWEGIRLNTSPVAEPLAMGWMAQLHRFIGGRATGQQPEKLEAFAFPR
jgi:hypothetical protein